MAAGYHERIRDSKGKGLSGDYTVHMTAHVLVGMNGANYIGVAECSDLDEYRKVTGKSIARGRAEKAMAIANGWLSQVDGDFKNVHILAPSGAIIEGQIWVPAELEDDPGDE